MWKWMLIGNLILTIPICFYFIRDTFYSNTSITRIFLLIIYPILFFWPFLLVLAGLVYLYEESNWFPTCLYTWFNEDIVPKRSNLQSLPDCVIEKEYPLVKWLRLKVK